MTLVELITAMMISMIVGAAAISILLVTMNLYTQYQLVNRQYIIIEHVEAVICQEIRSAENVIIADDIPFEGNSDSDIVTYNHITTTQASEIIKENSLGVEVLCGEAILSDRHTVRVEFHCNPTVSDSSSVLYAEIYLDEGTEYEVVESFYVRILNLEAIGGDVQEIMGASGNTIYYISTTL